MEFLWILIIFAISHIEGKMEIAYLKYEPFLNKIKEFNISQEKDSEFQIEVGNIYMFEIMNANYSYSFSSEKKNIFFIIKNGENITVPNETFFRYQEVIYVNLDNKLSEPTKIKVSPIPIYKELNSIETINENRYFFIESEENSMLYLDTFDRNSSIYISKTFKKDIFKNDTKITGQFYEIEPNNIYLIKNRIYSNQSISNFKKYFYPLNWNNTIIKNDEINFLYLQSNKTYILDFNQNTINKMIKLSSKIKIQQ